MLSLSHSILLRSVRTGELMSNTMRSTKMLKCIKSKLSTIIWSQCFDLRIKLILYRCFKELKNIKNIWFVFKKIEPSKFGIFINKKNIIMKIIRRCDRSWTPNIKMHQFKRFRGMKIRNRKRKLMHFATQAMLTMRKILVITWDTNITNRR